MSGLHDVLEGLTPDRKITENEVAVIRRYIENDGQLDLEDVKFLVRLLSDAEEVCPEFDELFFPTLKRVLLEDGRIGPDERFFLLKMLYSDGHVRDRERQFLLELQREVKEVCPDFESMCETALEAAPRNWCVGGTTR